MKFIWVFCYRVCKCIPNGLQGMWVSVRCSGRVVAYYAILDEAIGVVA